MGFLDWTRKLFTYNSEIPSSSDRKKRRQQNEEEEEEIEELIALDII